MRLQGGGGEATDRAPRPAATAISEKGSARGFCVQKYGRDMSGARKPRWRYAAPPRSDTYTGICDRLWRSGMLFASSSFGIRFCDFEFSVLHAADVAVDDPGVVFLSDVLVALWMSQSSSSSACPRGPE